MTEPKEDTKPMVQTRAPKKKTQGIFDNLRKLPDAHPVEEILGLAPTPTSPPTPPTPSTLPSPSTPPTPSTPSTSPRPPTVTTPSTPSTGATPRTAQTRRSPESQLAVAPERDFTRTANSIVRDGIPSGLFGENGGKAKQLYDTLYGLTRGAIVPRRKIRIPKDELMRKSGIGSDVTLKKNLTRLGSVGLVTESIFGGGTHGGNEYEVFIPEEIPSADFTPATLSTRATPPTPTMAPLSQAPVDPLESRDSTPGVSDISSTVYTLDKTSLKDNQSIDDELPGLARAIAAAAREVTGLELLPQEVDRWTEVGQLLADEFRIAAARTGSVSSPAAFFAAHLRRRLSKPPSAQPRADRQDAASDVGRNYATPTRTGPLSDADIDELAGACVAMLDTKAQPIDVTLADMNTERGGFLQADDIERVRERANALLPTNEPEERPNALTAEADSLEPRQE